MYIKQTLLSILLLSSSNLVADLNAPYQITVGDRLAQCIERKIPIIDRIKVQKNRSYTKYNKYYVAFNNNSIYINYNAKEKNIDVIYINNIHVENITSAERAKQTLLDLKQKLINPSLIFCQKQLAITDNIPITLIYIDPSLRSRKSKAIIEMDVSGKFLLP